ncbi:hypothetical protein PRIPAC_74939 [Pristionchus pacificus]|uniref:Uncharacterized protein n=1 Tax=Pristionchus pacificus TaxID=54126 RepID=A0A2A6B4Y5_PRIPA|nr:hypothetical protein PRIPAC_74939 [Pristionchus pacificus]|eukprot:PDM60940.1 hypothetical protein PRIPAC_54746 [Pristionchus pacificus]
MDVLCIKNAANPFTNAFGQSINCYAQNRISTRFEVIGKGTVQRKRGCEVLCDSKSTCAAFSFQDMGLTSSCVLLSSKASNDTCTVQTTIFKKKKSGCAARTNATAEFGDDPSRA